MKLFEKILGLLSILGMIMSVLFITGGGLVFTLSSTLLSVIYMFFGFALLNNIRLRKIFKKDSYKGLSSLRIIGSILTGLSLSITLVGILFKIQNWPGAEFNLFVGTIGLLIASMVGIVKYARKRNEFYSNIIKRIGIIATVALILLFIPTETLIELKYRNHPEYIKALKKSRANPNSLELQKKVEEERGKMYDIE